MASIDNYILKNKEDISRWVANLASKHIRNVFTSKYIGGGTNFWVGAISICGDARRLSKVLDVLVYYNLIKDHRYTHKFISSWSQSPMLEVLPNESKLKAYLRKEKMAIKRKFSAEPPRRDGSSPSGTLPKDGKYLNKIYSYPDIRSLNTRELIHVWLNPGQYILMKRDSSVVVYPKNKEAEADRALYKALVDSYFSRRIPEFLKFLYGIEVNLLTHQSSEYYYSPEHPLPVMRVVNKSKIDIKDLNKEEISDRLEYAKRLAVYSNKLVEDYSTLIKHVKKGGVIIDNKFLEKATPYLLEKAPLMLHLEDDRDKKLFKMLLDGSYAGKVK